MANGYTNWENMLDKENPDALIVATSYDQTQNFIERVINTGLPVLVEKPLALNHEKLSEIIDKTWANRDNVMVSYNRRFYDFVPEIISRINLGRDLVSIDLLLPEPLKPLISKFGERIRNDILIYMSSHWFDLVSYITKTKLHVESILKSFDSKVELAYTGLLYAEHRTPVTLRMNFDAPQIQQ